MLSAKELQAKIAQAQAAKASEALKHQQAAEAVAKQGMVIGDEDAHSRRV